MPNLIIKREKSMLGMFADMVCYVNDNVCCTVENGNEASCSVNAGLIKFKCGMPNNLMSDVFLIDTSKIEHIRIVVKQGALKPNVSVLTPGALFEIIKTPKSERKSVLKAEKKTAIQEERNCLFTKKVGSYFGMNEFTRRWAVRKSIFSPLEKGSFYNYEDILDFELLEDGTSVVKGGLGRAFVGGILFGGVGAVVGSVTGPKTAHQECTRLVIKITINNISSPVVYIDLLDLITSKRNRKYKTAFKNAQEIISLLQIICSTVENEQQIVNKSISFADELRKLKQLMDEGVISQQEFEKKKKTLLDR